MYNLLVKNEQCNIVENSGNLFVMLPDNRLFNAFSYMQENAPEGTEPARLNPSVDLPGVKMYELLKEATEKMNKAVKQETTDIKELVRDEITSAASNIIKAVTQIINAPATGTSLLNNALTDEALVKVIAEAVAKEIEIPAIQKKEITVKAGESIKKISGVVHPKFETVCNIINAGEAVYMTGPAGTGKSHIAKQAAEALGLDFYFSNCITQEFKITGFIDAGGKYHETEFYKAFTRGGLFFIDEIDASVPEALIHINSALANGWFDFPTGREEAHENFRVIAAGNTIGGGADEEYTGRYQLDAATLDRFMIIEINYSREIENAITGGNIELVQFAHEYRNACKNAGIKSLFTYRALTRIVKLEKVYGDRLGALLRDSLTKGLTGDDIRIICRDIDINNKYAKELKALSEIYI